MNPERNSHFSQFCLVESYMKYYHRRVVEAIKATITPIKTTQTIMPAKYLNITSVMMEKTVREILENKLKTKGTPHGLNSK